MHRGLHAVGGPGRARQRGQQVGAGGLPGGTGGGREKEGVRGIRRQARRPGLAAVRLPARPPAAPRTPQAPRPTSPAGAETVRTVRGPTPLRPRASVTAISRQHLAHRRFSPHSSPTRTQSLHWGGGYKKGGNTNVDLPVRQSIAHGRPANQSPDESAAGSGSTARPAAPPRPTPRPPHEAHMRRCSTVWWEPTAAGGRGMGGAGWGQRRPVCCALRTAPCPEHRAPAPPSNPQHTQHPPAAHL